MSNEIVKVNDTTGAKEIQKISYDLPEYDLGQTVLYLEASGKEETSVVSAVEFGAFLNKEGIVVSSIMYTLANGVLLEEDEITHFFPMEYEDEEDEFMVGQDVRFVFQTHSGVSNIKECRGDGVYLLANGYTVDGKNLSEIKEYDYAMGQRVSYWDGKNTVESVIRGKRNSNGPEYYLLNEWVPQEYIICEVEDE